jgi:tRNA pseudouridine38/39 synthase
MESHIKQLKNIIKKNKLKGNGFESSPKKARIFNFAKYKLRHIAIKLLYFGWNYSGFAAQEDNYKTIESALFEALIKTKLIVSRETSNYHRCGRTDKGVNAFSQVISLDVRTNLISGKGVITPDYYQGFDETQCETNREEINYTLILNNVLPEDIRVICWSPVMPSFSARFDCKSRTYKYLFPKADLDIERMRIGCNYLLGEHDFRNLCKMDVNNGVINYKRNILRADLKHYFSDSNNITNSDNYKQTNASYSMCELTITGSAFLWHQIRCIVALLFLIGERKEEPQIIDKLLDIENYPMKPQYCMSADFPLVLFDCEYNECNVENWIYDSKAIVELIKHLQSLWTQQMVRTEVIGLMLNSLHSTKLQTECDLFKISSQIDPLCMGVKHQIHKPLLERPFCGKFCDSLIFKYCFSVIFCF